MSFSPRKILVTGGAGFIGCNFVRYAIDSDDDITIVNLDLMTYAGSESNLDGINHNRHSLVHGDICDAPLVRHLMREHDIDTIVHFAAESHVDRSITGPAAFIQTNFVGTFTLLEAARDHARDRDGEFRFHHISTDEVYGTLGADDSAFTELTPYAPNSPYSASKAGSDHLVRAYFHTFGLPVVTTNCSNNYGPYQHNEKFIPTIIRSCVRQEPIPVYGDGSNIRDWLFVTDHCAAIGEVLRRGELGEVYNIGGNSEQSNIDVVRQVCALMDRMRPMKSGSHDSLISFVTDRPGHDWRYAIDTKKIATDLGWQPAETFEAGLEKTIQWYLDRL